MSTRSTRGLLAIALVCATACSHALYPVKRPEFDPGTEAFERGESLRATVAALIEAGNRGRMRATRERGEELGIGPLFRETGIDWFSAYDNLWLELPGRSERTVYLIAHYDHADANPFTFLSLLLNGVLDPAVELTYLSQGAVHNATGVAVVLELAAHLARKPERQFTYRILFPGSSQAGMRGSRAYVARLSREEKDLVLAAINVDMVGTTFRPNCIVGGLNDETLVDAMVESARTLEFQLGQDPESGTLDSSPFLRTSFLWDFARSLVINGVGGLLPQRGWFTGSHSAPTLNLSVCDRIGLTDVIGGVLLLPVGIGGLGDRASKVHMRRLYEAFEILRTGIEQTFEASPPQDDQPTGPDLEGSVP